jgi:hypothetical protein
MITTLVILAALVIRPAASCAARERPSGWADRRGK